VNWIRMDDYLRGVVASELGDRPMSELAAMQAQAITARSFAFAHLTEEPSRLYDVTSGVADQVYGGVAAESPSAIRAVESTRGLVLKFNGRVISAPYHSTCGGSTAAQSELWRAPDEPYLQRVSDRIPGSDHYYCDDSPRFRWTRTLEGPALNAALAQYLGAVSSAPGSRNPGELRDVSVSAKTASGRVATLSIVTDRGTFQVHGNDTRSILRTPGGEILSSSSFSIESVDRSGGHVARLVLKGAGYGHGVGMCQWGAIGRARAGQDFRQILRTYYPGTSIGRAN
jgi:stage II sporulation protein D